MYRSHSECELDAESVSQLLVPDGQPVLKVVLNHIMFNAIMNEL